MSKFQKCLDFLSLFCEYLFFSAFFSVILHIIGNLYRKIILYYYTMSLNRRLLHEKTRHAWATHGIEFFESDNIIYIPIYDKFINDVVFFLTILMKNLA